MRTWKFTPDSGTDPDPLTFAVIKADLNDVYGSGSDVPAVYVDDGRVYGLNADGTVTDHEIADTGAKYRNLNGTIEVSEKV